MPSYTHLTKEERYQIAVLKKAGHKKSAIAALLGRCKSTISREFARNTGKKGYRPKQADKLARARIAKNAKQFDQEDWNKVDAALRDYLSPEQVSGRFKRTGVLSISVEAIYQHVYQDCKEGGNLIAYLRCQKKRKKRYGSGKDKRGQIVNRVGIEHRPAIVDERVRFGDWEGDTVIGKNHQGVVVTLVERKSRYTLALPCASKEAACVGEAIRGLLLPHKDRCHTITFDNGREFAGHEAIAKALACKVFFAKPYHSWERGCNENTNGLLRQFLPKHLNLKTVSKEQVQLAVDALNHRPRKCLGYLTPHEVFLKQQSQLIATAVSVALRG